MAVIPVKLDGETIRLIDALVDMGIFKSRNEAIRRMVKSSLKSILTPVINERVIRVVSELLKIENAVKIVSEEPAWRIISEERERI